MGRTSEIQFAHASTRLVSEILLYVQRFDEQHPPAPGPSLALLRASEAAQALEEAARHGGDLEAAYEAASSALDEAADALSRTPPPSFAAACRIVGHADLVRRRAPVG